MTKLSDVKYSFVPIEWSTDRALWRNCNYFTDLETHIERKFHVIHYLCIAWSQNLRLFYAFS